MNTYNIHVIAKGKTYTYDVDAIDFSHAMVILTDHMKEHNKSIVSSEIESITLAKTSPDGTVRYMGSFENVALEINHATR